MIAVVVVVVVAVVVVVLLLLRYATPMGGTHAPPIGVSRLGAAWNLEQMACPMSVSLHGTATNQAKAMFSMAVVGSSIARS